MSKNYRYSTKLEPFKVSDDLLEKVIDGLDEVEEIDGYQGHPITGVGDVHTPPDIVNFILDSVNYTEGNNIEHKRIVDLSCGTGSFVREIVSRLRDRLIKIGYNPEDPHGAKQIISTVQNNVAAFDIKSLAVWRTAQLVIKELEVEIESTNQLNPISRLPIYHTNSLYPIPEIKSKRFDVVVGNPPYIKNSDIKSEDDDVYREGYETAKGKYDIYPLFFEKGIQLLNKGGKLGYVTPDRFHQTDYGKPLRNIILEQTYIQSIINLEDDPFPVVNAYPSITILEKQDNSFPNYQRGNRFFYCEAMAKELERARKITKGEENPSDSGQCSLHHQQELGEDAWRLIPPHLNEVKSILEERLQSIADTRIRIKTGIATGADDIFILDDVDAQRLPKDIVFPVIKGEHVKKGFIDDSTKSILNPYTMDDKLIDLDKYPEAKNYLEYYRPKLEERYCVRENNKYWYETHDTIDTVTEIQKRIVTPDLTSSSRFAITERAISHNTCYSLYYPGDLPVLVAFLNSNAFEFLLKSSLPKMDSGYWRQMKRDLESIPVITPEQINSEVARRLTEYYNDRDWDKVNKIVYDVLDIDRSKQGKIESFINNETT